MSLGTGDESFDFFSRYEIVAEYQELEGLTAAESTALDGRLGPSTRLLDVGIGTGRTTGILAQRCGTYVGIDYAPPMIEAAKSTYPGLDVRVGDARNLREFSDSTFDLVLFSFNGLDCLDWHGRQQCLDEFRRVLDGNGYLVFSSHDPWSFIRVTPRSEARSPLRASVVSIYRTLRALVEVVMTPGTWKGRGYRRDLADPIDLYHATPLHIRTELDASGFDLIKAIPSTHWGNRFLRPAWWYYVCRRR